ncbi:3-oxoacyl-[acyl-carrier-protein] synthase II [Luteibacter rhizovicinus]|uniref:3-oxoacyl-[acyl-carrier-protein] synthase 2 n=1 Tax=Luteibacter rhizovicinus TaxID=242606 RepID=A0A4R3YXX9_9GAMM|nr:beta-ketoacyl-ACP synthase II [Luteibacter rhizovicinus]TCV97402.1 3-oxoacyl-[acyl-carrier-protein] synthase II [Luteibacter rhizovicinus]
MSKRRVVVTGMGIVSPVGNDVATAWNNVVNGVSGIGPVTAFDASAYATRIAGEVQGFDPVTAYFQGVNAPEDELRSIGKDFKRMDPFIHYGIVAGTHAFRQSGLVVTDENAGRIGVAAGAGIGGLHTIEATAIELAEKGPRKVSPFYVPSSIINMIAGNLSIYHGMKGPNIALVSACTTAAHNIGMAMRLIQYGDADAMLAGGAEFATTPTAMAGFCSAKAMSTRNDDPKHASRPWDTGRDGFLLSNGAGMLMLEEYEFAKARGANILAEIIGFGMSGDAYHITAPSGDGAELAMRNALHDAHLDASGVQYVNAHGTSTPVGDRGEARAIANVFGDHAKAKDGLKVSSTKSVTGHLLGAAGGVEAIFSVMALRDGVIPPTMNLVDVDPEVAVLGLDLVPNEARQAKLDVVVSNSFGFGGTNGTLAFKRV